MIIVMDNRNAVRPGEDASLFATRGVIGRRSIADVAPTPGGRGPAPAAGGRGGGLAGNWHEVLTPVLLTDLIPMVERTCRALPGRENRAMAGLSMGGMQSFMTVLSNTDNKKMKELFLGIGSVEGPNPKNLQRHADQGRHSQCLFRITRRRPRMADVAPLPERLRATPFQINGREIPVTV